MRVCTFVPETPDPDYFNFKFSFFNVSFSDNLIRIYTIHVYICYGMSIVSTFNDPQNKIKNTLTYDRYLLLRRRIRFKHDLHN